MAELPFTDTVQDGTPPTMPHVVEVPKPSGVRQAIVIGGGVLVLVLVVGFVLFGVRKAATLQQRPERERPAPPPRAALGMDPLHGLQGYEALMRQPAPPGATAPMLAAQAPAQTPVVRETHSRPEKPVDRSPLIVQGKAMQAVSHDGDPIPPAIPSYQRQEPGREARGEPQPPETVQERQQRFLDQAQTLRSTQVNDTLHTPVSPWMVLAGDIIPATLEPGIESDLPGTLKARVRQSVRDSVRGDVVLIPQGTILIGAYNNEVAYGQNRVLIVWHRLRLPNGQTIQLEGMPGVDLSGYAGLKDKVNNHLWPLFRAVFLSSVLSIGSRIPAGSSPQNYQQSLAQEFSQDFGSAANRAGQQIVQRELTRPPTITIRPGMNFNVFVLKDLVLQPYTGLVARGR